MIVIEVSLRATAKFWENRVKIALDFANRCVRFGRASQCQRRYARNFGSLYGISEKMLLADLFQRPTVGAVEFDYDGQTLLDGDFVNTILITVERRECAGRLIALFGQGIEDHIRK